MLEEDTKFEKSVSELADSLENLYDILELEITQIRAEYAIRNSAISIQISCETNPQITSELRAQLEVLDSECEEKIAEKREEIETYKQKFREKISLQKIERDEKFKIEIIDDSMIEFAYLVYLENPWKVLQALIDQGLSCMYHFRPFFSANYEFLNIFPENIKELCIKMIHMSNKYQDPTIDIYESYIKNLDDLILWAKIINMPPFPLLHSNHEDELETDALPKFTEVSNYGLEKFKNMNSKLLSQVLTKNVIKENLFFTLNFSIGKKIISYEIHRNILMEYPEFFRNGELPIEIENVELAEQVLTYLYTGTFDFKFINLIGLLEFSKNNFLPRLTELTEILILGDKMSKDTSEVQEDV